MMIGGWFAGEKRRAMNGKRNAADTRLTENEETAIAVP
jgi:hypothetical protein